MNLQKTYRVNTRVQNLMDSVLMNAITGNKSLVFSCGMSNFSLT